MLEFEVTVITTRVGSHTVRVEAGSAAAARELVRGECESGQCHCPPEWCTDDVESEVASARELAHHPSRMRRRTESVQGGHAIEPDRVDRGTIRQQP
jgi:hypothetical protein